MTMLFGKSWIVHLYMWFLVPESSYVYSYRHTHCLYYGQAEMACQLHPIIFIWNAVTSYTPVIIILSTWGAVMVNEMKNKICAVSGFSIYPRPSVQCWVYKSCQRAICSYPKIVLYWAATTPKNIFYCYLMDEHSIYHDCGLCVLNGMV